MNSIKLYSADCRGVESNCIYPHEAIITDVEALRNAVQHDYVCVQYENEYRSKDNFISSNCLGQDCDNDHSEDPEDWITPEDVRAKFQDVPLAIHYSRNHGKPKHGESARPRFHVFFLIDEMTDHAAYSDLKKRVHNVFPFFDKKALDAARFFFGTQNPEVEFYPGMITLNECLDMYYPEDTDLAEDWDDENSFHGVIPEGSRNATMSHFAGRVLKRYGDTEEAYVAFHQRATQCDPPLDDSELHTIWHSAQGFYKRISVQDGYVSPEAYNSGYLYKPDDDTDVGEARMLARVFADRLRYSDATEYLHYSGVIWEESIPMAHAILHDLTDMQLAESRRAAARAWKVLENNGVAEILKTTPSKKKAIGKFNEAQAAAFAVYEAAVAYVSLAMKYRGSRNIQAVLNEVPSMVLIQPQDLDKDPFLLNTPNGTYDLTKGLEGAVSHQADHFMTKVTTVDPGEKGKRLWLDALNTFFSGDAELIRYVQLVAGLVAVGQVFIEALIIAYGDGRNGKSTFWNALSRVLGSYSGNISADTLTVGCRRNIKPELAEAKGKRLLIAAELEEGTRFNTSTVKQLCSTDDIYAEKKFKAPFSYVPSHTLVLYTNHLPKVGATDTGIWRRLIVIPFSAKIEGQSDIKNYADYLYENAAPAILAWILEGAQEVIQRKFKIDLPVCVRKAIDAYHEDNDWLGHFLAERCEIGAGLEAKSGELYAAYRVFCMETGEYIRSTTDFYAALECEGFKRHKTNVGAFIYGIQLYNIQSDDDFLK